MGGIFMNKKKQKGFTLIELIVVIAIIGVLAAILVPSMIGYVKKSKRTADVANAKQIHTDIVSLLLENDEARSSFYDPNGSGSGGITMHDAQLDSDYQLVLTMRIDGGPGVSTHNYNWVGVRNETQDAAAAFNTRLGYASGQNDIKVPIRLVEQDGQKLNQWMIGYRKNSPDTIEIWVGSANQPLICLYTQKSSKK